MFKAIGQFFNALFTMFSALDKGAASLDHLAGIAEAEADGLANIMAIEREEKLIRMRHQLAVTTSAGPASFDEGRVPNVAAII